MKAVAPIVRASSARVIELAVTATAPAPSRRAQKAVARPIGPAPITSTRAPAGISEMLTPCSPTESGSMSAPSCSETVRGSTRHWRSLASASWPYPPPSMRIAAHQACSPAAHAAQRPQLRTGRTATRSPRLTRRASAPTSMTSPHHSCPSTVPPGTANVGSSVMCRSLPQIPQRSTRTSTSSPTGEGSGRRSIESGSPSFVKTAAFIRAVPPP
jgi:hypothetical protein